MSSAATRTAVNQSYTSGAIGNTENTTDKIKSLAQARFGVFSYLTTGDYNPASTELAPNFMYDQELIYDDALQTSGAWYYTPVKYWPNGVDAANPENTPSNSALEMTTQKLSFYAYAPYKAMGLFNTAGTGNSGTDFPAALSANTNFKTIASPDAGNGIVAMTTNTFTGNVWLKYMLPKATEDEAVDLLWGLRGSGSYSETDNSASTGTVGTDYNINLTKQTVGEKVKFLFKHALSKIQGSSTTTSTNLDQASTKAGISVKLDVDSNNGDEQNSYLNSSFNNAKTLVTIKSVKIQDGVTAYNDANTALTTATTSDIYKSGWFNIEKGQWDFKGAVKGATIDILIQNDKTKDVTAVPANKTTYTLNPAIRENTADPAVKNATGVDWNSSASNETNGYTGGASGVTVAAQNLFANEYVPGLMFIPGTDAQTLYVTVDYIVRTADANLATGYTEVEQIITNKVTLPAAALGSNKIFKLIMHLGLTSVKFEAVVSDWQYQSDSTIDENGTETGGSTDNEKSIWLPSNVVAYEVNKEVAGAENSASFDISGYNIGNYVSCSASPDIDFKEVTGTGTDLTLKFDNPNKTATNNVNVVTIVGELGKVTVTLTHKAGVITMGDVSKNSDIAVAGEIITISNVKAGESNVTVSANPAVTITATPTGLTGSITSDGVLSIDVPANTGDAPVTWTISKIKIGDAEYTPDPAITLVQNAPTPAP